MGGFIAALRRSAGMTQRELAERLNVSDKSVSRWECDDGYPDLSLIPVIAEIFGVTSDELLRGERKSAEERAVEDSSLGQKGKKELKRLRQVALRDFRSLSFLVIGIALLGLLIAAIANLGFLRALIGFFSGMVFLVIAIALESMFLNDTLSKDFEDDDDCSFAWNVVRTSEASFAAMFVIVGFLLPLLYLVKDTYLGLSGASWLLHGCICAFAMTVVSCIAIHFINGKLVRSGKLTLSESEKVGYLKRYTLKTYIGLGLVVVAIFTVVLHVSLTQMWGPNTVMKGTQFNDYESFVALMETDVPDTYTSAANRAPMSIEEVEAGEKVYYDKYGNIISEEEARTRTLTDLHGSVVLTYVDRNHSVLSVSYNPKDGSVLPITVYTYDDYQVGQAVVRMRNVIFAFVYMAEVILAFVVYAAMKKKLK